MSRTERYLLLGGAVLIGYSLLTRSAAASIAPGQTPTDPATGLPLTPEAFQAYGQFYYEEAAPSGITGPQYYPVPFFGGGGFGRY